MSVDTTTTDAARDAADAAETAADTLPGVTDAAEADTPDTNDYDTTGTEITAADTAADLAAETGSVLDTGTDVTFASLDLPAPLVGVLNEAGVTTAFPIQAATIPDALVGRDVLGRGQTGSGKTLAFGLSMLARIAASGRSKPRRPKGLVLVPTRELAMQVNDVLTPVATAMGLFTKTAFGGSPYQTQVYALDRGVDGLGATPG